MKKIKIICEGWRNGSGFTYCSTLDWIDYNDGDNLEEIVKEYAGDTFTEDEIKDDLAKGKDCKLTGILYDCDEDGEVIDEDEKLASSSVWESDFKRPEPKKKLNQEERKHYRIFPGDLKKENNMETEIKAPQTHSEIIAAARTEARRLAMETGEPHVTIEHSENTAFNAGDVLPLYEADKKLAALDAAHEGAGYDKTTLSIDFVMKDRPASYDGCRFDIGDEGAGLVAHVQELSEFYTSKEWLRRSNKNINDEEYLAHRAAFEHILNDVVPYFKQHVELSELLEKAKNSDMTAQEQADVKTYVTKERTNLNLTAKPEAFEPGPSEIYEKHKKEMAADASASQQPQAQEVNYRDRIKNIRDEMVQTIINYIEKDPSKWESGWNSIVSGAQINGKTEKAYRGFNSLYLMVIAMEHGYSDPRWVTFNQAKELGASVKKGEKSVPVVFFELYDKLTKKAFENKTVKGMTEEEKTAYLKENVYAVLKYSSVFNAAQCQNFPELNLDAYKMSEEERSNQNEMIETIIANSAAPITYDGGNRAYYSPGTDSIHLPVIEAFNSMQDYYATALHEIAHSTGHESRLNRFSTANDVDSYAREELRAELACVFMQVEHGIKLEGKHIENHAAYLKSWLDETKNDSSVFFKAASDAQKIADYVSENYLQSVKVAEDENTKETDQQKATQNLSESVKEWMGEHKEKNVQNATPQHMPQITASEANVQVQTPPRKWLSIELPEGAIGKQYGNNTLIRMPEGEYGHYALFVPTKLILEKDGKKQLRVASDYVYRLNNDGKQVELTGQELSDSFAGVQIGKQYKRVAPSRHNAAVFEQLEKNVPLEMRSLPNWCVYKTRWNDEKGKKEKFVLSALDGHWAKANEPARWTDFETAMKYARENNCAGLSFALDAKAGITCIDLDKSIDENGHYNELAAKLTNAIKGTYIEQSTSGNGMHIFLKDDVLKNGKYKSTATTAGGELEVYDSVHIISMTGDMLSETNSLGKCPAATAAYLRETLGEKPQISERPQNNVRNGYQAGSDREVVERIRRSKVGAEFDALSSGEGISGDRSKDDMRMANILAFFTDGDASQMLRIFKDSAIYRADKPDSYYIHSIDKAIDTLVARPKYGVTAGAGRTKSSGAEH